VYVCVRAGAYWRVRKVNDFPAEFNAEPPCWKRRTLARSTHFCALTPDRRKTPKPCPSPCPQATLTQTHTGFPPLHTHTHTHTHAHLFVCIVQWQPSLIWFSYAERNLRVEWIRIQRPLLVGVHLYRSFMNFGILYFTILYIKICMLQSMFTVRKKRYFKPTFCLTCLVHIWLLKFIQTYYTNINIKIWFLTMFL